MYTHSIIKRGRPKLDALMRDLAGDYNADDVMVMVCGPEQLIADASRLSFQHGFHFHTEIFHF